MHVCADAIPDPGAQPVLLATHTLAWPAHALGRVRLAPATHRRRVQQADSSSRSVGIRCGLVFHKALAMVDRPNAAATVADARHGKPHRPTPVRLCGCFLVFCVCVRAAIMGPEGVSGGLRVKHTAHNPSPKREQGNQPDTNQCAPCAPCAPYSPCRHASIVRKRSMFQGVDQVQVEDLLGSGVELTLTQLPSASSIRTAPTNIFMFPEVA